MINWNELPIYLIPFLSIGIPILVLIHWFLKNDIKKKQLEIIQKTRSEVIPIRLQAYERLSLLLERITPEALIIREQKQGLTSLQLHSQLLKSIRHEFEHNLAMQVYLPQKTWDLVSQAKDEVMKMINTSSAQVAPNSPSMELARYLLETAGNETTYHIKKAMKALKTDVQLFFYDD